MALMKRFAVGVIGAMALVLVGTATPLTVGATAPAAYNPNLPVAYGSAVSASHSNNPNETTTLYRPGGTSQVYTIQTQAVTNGGTQVRDVNTGAPIYQTVLTKPVTYNPPNGTITGEPQAFIVVGPYGDAYYASPANVAYPYSYPYGYPYGPYYPTKLPRP